MDSNERPSKLKHPLLVNALWFILAWLLIIYAFGFYSSSAQMGDISYSAFKDRINQGQVASVTVSGDKIKGRFKEPQKLGTGDGVALQPEFNTTMPSFSDPNLMSTLQKQNVTINAVSQKASWLGTVLIYTLPWILILGFFYYTSRKMQGRGGAGGSLFGFGKSKAVLYNRSTSKTTFKDVAGLTNAKKEFSEIIDFLKDPSKYRAIGAKLPKGILLAGPPGTGKTLMARATAGEADVPFYSISGSEFIEMFVGVGASRVRDMFANAKRDAPAIIFIDELDSIGRVRGTGVGGGHDEREQTLNQILAEMDGFSAQTSVIVLAATNRPDVLDPALVRPGRFDRQITLDLPQRNARREILQLHAREVPLAEDVNLDSLAKRTVGFSGAELMNLVNEAALLAARKGKRKVEAEDFDQGMDKILMGLEREDLINDEEKRAVAYHEAGHALMAKLLPGTDPLSKVSIIPRGRSLGATEQLPEEDRHNLGRTYLLSRIAIMLGGRVAEKLVYQDITTGAGDDLKKATELARRMVCQWGMSDALGPVTFPRGEHHPFLGREMTEARDFSEHTARLIDDEIRNILLQMEEKCEKLLRSNRRKLEVLTEALLEHEVLLNEEVDRLLGLNTEPVEDRLSPREQVA